MTRIHYAAALAVAGAAIYAPARAHVVVGERTFPVTLTFDDPGVGDEATLPNLVWQRSAGPSNQYQGQWEYDKRITETTALIYNQGYDLFQTPGQNNKTAFENIVITGKWQGYTNPDHEFVASFGVQREMYGGPATANIGGDFYGATAPTLYFGKGLGDLPIGNLRPLAVTGELSLAVPDRRLNWNLDNNGTPLTWKGGLSLQYSIPYLQSQVKDYGLPEYIGRLNPLVEVTWTSPAASPGGGNPMQLMAGVGALYLGDSYQLGLEALIPLNKAAGQNVGVIFQLHWYFDDIFPNTLGKPLANWFK
jgi:hypothetical protein